MTRFSVPKGWTKGHALRCMGNGPRYALFQTFDPKIDYDPNYVPAADDIAAVEFNSREAIQEFVDWWYADTSSEVQK